MNIELLEKVKKHILEEPRRLDMAEWKLKVDFDDQDNPPCGTIGCIAGWATMLSGLDLVRFEVIEGKATELLALTQDQAESLFYRQYWPVKFTQGWVDLGKQQKVDRTIARIDHMIATGE